MEETTKRSSTLPFVLSLLSVVFLFAPAFGAIAALVLGIIGLVLTINARKTDTSTLLTAAFVLSIIGIAIGGLELLFVLLAVGFISSVASGVMDGVLGTIFY